MGSNLLKELQALGARLSGIKPGIKTTEFVYSATVSIIGILVSLGVLHHGIPTKDLGEVKASAAGLVALVTAGYSISRGLAKRGAAQSWLYDLKTLLADVNEGDPGAAAIVDALVPSLLRKAGASPNAYASLKADLEKLKTLVESLNSSDKTEASAPDVGDGHADVQPGNMPMFPPGLVGVASQVNAPVSVTTAGSTAEFSVTQ